jgi:NAD(P)H-nitrite reductase large subunit
MPKYLIIGNSAGGIGAAEAIRELDATGSLAIVSDEAFPAYSRPLISEYLAGETSIQKMLYRPEGFYSKNSIRALLGKRALRIDLERHCVELDDGGGLDFEKLLLATGGVPFVPSIDGKWRRGVYTFTTLRDAQQIEQHLAEARRAVVIGGGLIGISATEALAHRGLAVTVVELKDRILNVLLDEKAAAIAQAAVTGAGVRVVVNATVKSITGRPGDNDVVGGVVLDSGEAIECDIVIVAIGVVPRTDLVAGTGITVNRGVVVDRFMETSEPGVYACGDVAEAYDFIFDGNRVVPIWPNAYIGGRIAGRNMAGVPTEYKGGTSMNSLKYFGLSIVSAGVVGGLESGNGYEVVVGGGLDGSPYRKIVVQNNRIVGMTFVDDIERSGVVLGLMREKVDVEALKEAIVGDEFGFAVLPSDLRLARFGLKNSSRQPVQEQTVCQAGDVDGLSD